MSEQYETRFEMTPEHLKLLRAMYVGWDDMEFGAPAIDPKRPYGNSSVLYDIAEILGVVKGDDEEFSEAQEHRMRRLHAETQTALQVAIDTGAFRDGVYEREKYGKWRFVR